MKTSLVLLGILATGYGASQYFETENPARTPVQQELINPKLQSQWNISRSDQRTQCVFTTTGGSDQSIKPITSSDCENITSGLGQLSQIKMNSNGDIILYNRSGTRIVQFIETESAALDSIWPKYPLLTLAKLE